jgi:hypothetical protein
VNDQTAPTTASIREYARRCGWAPSYVHKLKAAGTLPCIDGKIDVARADAILAQRSDPGRKGGSQRRKARAGKSPTPTRPSEPNGAPADTLAAADADYTNRRSTKTDLENDLLRERLARERGESIDRAAAVRLLRDLGAGFGGMAERYPDRISSQVAAQLGVDPHRCRSLLVAMAKELRDEFATLAQSLASRMGTTLE